MTASPLHVSRLSLHYDTVEDRLVLMAVSDEEKAVALHLTRRLTARLINGISHLLERSSALAQRAPLDMRGDVILLEHQRALTRAETSVRPAGSGAVALGKARRSGGAKQAAVPARLVRAVNIATRPAAFDIVLNDQRAAAARFSASRAELHQLLEHLRRVSGSADWALSADAAWLRQESRELILN